MSSRYSLKSPTPLNTIHPGSVNQAAVPALLKKSNTQITPNKKSGIEHLEKTKLRREKMQYSFSLETTGPVGFEPTISGSEGRHLNPC